MKAILYLTLMLAVAAFGKPFEIKVRQLTYGPATHFFGYIGHVGNVPWSGDGRYILALRTTMLDHLPGADDPAEIILIDTQNDDAITVVDETRGWNPQQGTMFYWNPHAPETQFFFNDRDRDTGKVFTVLYDIEKRERIQEYRVVGTAVANSGVAQKGEHFYAINYARMARLRKVTGYAGTKDTTEGVAHPKNDGVFRIGIESGESKLLVSFHQLAEALRATGKYTTIPALFINHTLANRENDRVFFFARGGWDGHEGPKVNQGFVMRPDGSELMLVKKHIGGHPEWDAGHRMIGRIGDKQVVYDMDQQEVVGQLGNPDIFPNPEGDVALSPSGDWFVNGFKSRKAKSSYYVVYRRSDGASVRSPGFNIGNLVSGDLRQDPSPCWNRDNNQILVPAIAKDGKSRQLFVLTIESAPGAP